MFVICVIVLATLRSKWYVRDIATRTRKRANGEGTIYFHEGMGVWVGMLDLGYVEGKRKRKKFTGKTRQEVAKKLAAVAVAREAGIEPGDDRERLDAFLDRWLLHVKARFGRAPTSPMPRFATCT
ncbi:MAG: hypothetical protein Kow00129_11070 [Thermoleophilia bacterium]